jgi:hypothetical protein
VTVDEVLTVPFATLAGLLLVAGVAKLRSPAAALRALALAGLPAAPALARGLGAAELALGTICLLAPGRVGALALTVAFAAFAWFLIRLMRREADSAPCGCFGDSSSGASPVHLVFDLCAVVIAALAVVAPPPALTDVGAHGMELFALLVGTAGSVYLCFLIFTALPSLWTSYGASGGSVGASG